MPMISVIRDIDRSDHPPIDPETIIHVTSPITIGTLAAGMTSGKTSVMIIIPLPSGQTVIAESSLECMKAVGQVLSAIP